MGHFHSSQMDELLLKKIYEKGSASINDCVEAALEQGMGLSASEGTYYEKFMLQHGFHILFALHYDRHDVVPIGEQPKTFELIEWWCSPDYEEEFDNETGESSNRTAEVEQIQFRFLEHKREHYNKLTIIEVDS